MDKPKKKWYLRWWMIVLYVFIGLGILGSFVDDGETTQTIKSTQPTAVSEPKAEPVEEAIKVSAIDLFLEYENNEVKADELYKGKTLEVSGIIGDIGKDILDQMYITLETGDLVQKAQAYIKSSEKSKVMDLTVGQEITIRCKGGGKLMFVILKDCVIE